MAVSGARPHQKQDEEYGDTEIDLERRCRDGIPYVMGVELGLLLVGAEDYDDGAGYSNDDAPEIALSKVLAKEDGSDDAVGYQSKDTQGRHDGSGGEAVGQKVAHLADGHQNLAGPPGRGLEIGRGDLGIGTLVFGPGGVGGVEGLSQRMGLLGGPIFVFIDARIGYYGRLGGAVTGTGKVLNPFQGFLRTPPRLGTAAMELDMRISLYVQGEGDQDVSNNSRNYADKGTPVSQPRTSSSSSSLIAILRIRHGPARVEYVVVYYG